MSGGGSIGWRGGFFGEFFEALALGFGEQEDGGEEASDLAHCRSDAVAGGADSISEKSDCGVLITWPTENLSLLMGFLGGWCAA